MGWLDGFCEGRFVGGIVGTFETGCLEGLGVDIFCGEELGEDVSKANSVSVDPFFNRLSSNEFLLEP